METNFYSPSDSFFKSINFLRASAFSGIFLGHTELAKVLRFCWKLWEKIRLLTTKKNELLQFVQPNYPEFMLKNDELNCKNMKIYHIKKLYVTKFKPHHYSEKGNTQLLVFTVTLVLFVESILTKFDGNIEPYWVIYVRAKVP